ncbi:MAG: TonB-dependent receptor [Muribaculaceae bacterium]|nr:TonB-dependent receptor [Muribaculaceae bacterium]
MKKILLLSLLAYTFAARGNETTDTLIAPMLDEVTVEATRASDKSPMAFNNLNREQIAAMNHGKDVPAMLNMLPGVTMSSDAGMGIGYTGLHVRGTDPTRINVTANGVPLNDAESSQLYWVNMCDFASSLQSLQLQRGVGTSTNGAGSFGASLNLLTDGIGAAGAGVAVSAGSYGTHKETVRFSTGLLSGHWGVQGRLSHIGSDGYIDRASSRLNSYFLQACYYDANTTVKLITYNGTEKTYMAWDYASRADMAKYGRTYNPSGKYRDAEGNVAFYDNQTDNYHQQHYQLLWNQLLGTNWRFHLALHYTRGDGYYEQYKTDQKLYKYHLDDGLRADLVRQKKMLNDFYGNVASFNYDNHRNLTLNLGGGWNKYDGDHYGEVKWVGDKYYYDDDDNPVYVAGNGTMRPTGRYYDNNAKKTDGNIYAKVNYQPVEWLNAFADMQYRHISYTMSGSSQEYDSDHHQRPLELKRKWDFFNPKVGITILPAPGHTIYASWGVAHKEPTRNDFEDMLAESTPVDPHAERLNDLEVGYKFKRGIVTASLGGYYMSYDNQFVLTGAQDANGEMVARNIKDSYRMGLELELAVKPFDWFDWQANVAFSRNRARHMQLTVINPDWSESMVDVGSTPLSYSPNVVLNNMLTFTYKGFRATLMTKYVGRQMMTNSGFDKYLEDDGSYTDAVLDAAFLNDLDVSYTFHFKWLKSATIGVTVYNLFNEKWDSNGSCSMNFRRDGDRVVAYNGGWAWATFSAQAPTHVLAHLTLNF